MKAAVFYGPGDIRVEDKPKPDIGDNDILIKIEACAICGTDLRIFRSGHRGVKPPQIIGHENAGIIFEMGKNVKNFKVGDRVTIDPIVSCGYCYYCRKGLTNLCSTFKETAEAFGYYYPGGFAEYMAIPAKAIKRGNIIPIPESMSFEEAALAEPMGCALNGELLARIGAGDTVLIVGAGPVGVMHANLAKILGAAKIIISELEDNRLKVAKEMEAADYYINPAREDLKKLLAHTKDLDLTMHSKVAGGDVDVKLHNDDLRADLKSIQTLDALKMLIYPEVFKSSLNGVLDYNIAEQKGKFNGDLVDGLFTKNQVLTLVKQYAKIDLYKQKFKGVVSANINKEKILASLDLKSNTSSITTKNTKLNSKTQKINSKIDIVANKHPIYVTLTGNTASPKVKIDAGEILKEKAKDKVKEKLKKKLGDKLGEDVGNLLKGLF